LTNEQANGINAHLMNVVNQSIVNMEKAEAEAAQKAEAQLRQEWGADFDKNKSMVADTLMKVGGQELIDAMGGPDGLGNNATVLKAMAKIIGQLGEDAVQSITVTSQQAASGTETPEEAKTKIAEMNSDKAHPIWNEKDPKHKDAVDERQRLYKIAYLSGE
jgi:hypothetical protein